MFLLFEKITVLHRIKSKRFWGSHN